jgi:di/tricarboxylate transporter
MSFDGILVLIVLAFILISLYFEIVGPGFTFVIGIAVLGAFRVLTPSEILQGFANEQIAVIIMLLLLGDVFRRTSVLDIFFDQVFKYAKSYKHFMARLMFIVAPLSAFLNNTPLVAVLIPYVHNWSTKNKVHVSKLMMPLSFAAILGGCATLIGTSTNLIVNGLVLDQDVIPDLKPLEVFDFAYVGVPMIFIGALYMLLVGHKLIPERKETLQNLPTDTREYVFELQLKKGSEVIGQSRSQAQFLKNEGFILAEVYREGVLYQQISQNFIFQEDDILLFVGKKEAIAELVNADKKRIIPSVGMFSRRPTSEIIEIVVSHKSSMIGKRLMYENFRGKYDATVLAVHRNGENINGQIANIELRAGDALLLMAGSEFNELSKSTQDFYLISKIKEIRRLGLLKTATLVVGTPLVILLNVLGISKLFTGLLVLLILTQFLKIITPKEMAQSVDYELAFIIALSLALGIAMINTGVAEILANGIMYAFKPLGKYGALYGIYIITALLAAFVTNKAAVAIVFPIALSISMQMHLPPTPFVLIVSFAAAANFMTPIGYQTNLMIYGPGGYKFRDFLKVGTPLTLIYMLVTVTILSRIYF